MTAKRFPKTLLIVLLVLLVFGFIASIVVSLILQSGILDLTVLAGRAAYSVFFFLLLLVFYYLRYQGSARQLRVFWIVIAAVVFAFPFAAVCVVIARAPIGSSGSSLFVPLYLVGLVAGGLIGYFVGRREAKAETVNT